MKIIHYIFILLFSLSLCASENFVTRDETSNEIIYNNNSMYAVFNKLYNAYTASEKILTKTGSYNTSLDNPKYYFELLEQQYLEQNGNPEAIEFKQPGELDEFAKFEEITESNENF